MGASSVRLVTLYSMWAWETEVANEAAVSRAAVAGEMRTMMTRC